MAKSKVVLGIDVGASGIKGALVDVKKGKLLDKRIRLETPQPATPEALTAVFQQLITKLEYDGDIIGVGFPAVVIDGVAKSAANIHVDWINTSVEKMWSEVTSKQVYCINDADAAGLASMKYGLVNDQTGVSIFLTLGTGIGSAIFINNKLVPNTELGHLYMSNGLKCEKYASNKVRETENLEWDVWGQRLNEILLYINSCFSPKLILLGGGISKKFELYEDYLTVDTEVKAAQLYNQAGIIGAALNAYQQSKNS